jgi:hypothetical protein
MELNRITLIIVHAAIITVIYNVITSGETSIPLKIVAITASPLEITRIVTGQESILLIVITGLGLIPTNQECARSISSIILNTNVVAIRTDPTRLDTIQITARALNNTTQAHNTGDAINTEVRNEENLIAILDRLVVSRAINNLAATFTEKADSLAVMIVISDLFATILGPIHRTHVGRVVLPDNLTNIQAGLKN